MVVVLTGSWSTQLQGTVTDWSRKHAGSAQGPPPAPVGVQPAGLTVEVTMGQDLHGSGCKSIIVL